MTADGLDFAMAKRYEVSRALEVDADPEVCYDLLCEFENYPDWFKFVRESKVLKKDDNGTPVKAMFVCDIITKVVSKRGFLVVNEYGYERDKYKLTYRVVDGIVNEAAGYYQFRRLNSGRCLAVFHVNINFGAPLPQKIVNYLMETLMDGVLAMIKKKSEKLVKGG
jgi:ribosome-associated toxin RatA of RatAB toxin-antitoxin module